IKYTLLRFMTLSYFFFSSRRRHTRFSRDWSSDVCSSDLIENNRIKLNEQDVSNLTKRIEGVKYYRFIQNNFKDVYYLQDENVWLDRVVSNIFQMNHYQPHVLQYKRSLAYYSLFQSSIIKRPFNLFHRKNLYLRTSDVERNFGNKTTWDKSFENYLRKFSDEVNSLVFNSGRNCRSLNESAFD